MVLVDALLIILSFWGAYQLRFEFSFPLREWETFIQTLPFLLMVKMGTFAFFHLYQGMWRYTSVVDLIKVIQAVLISSLLLVLSFFMLNRLAGYPRSIFFIDAILTFLTIGGVRILIRLYFSKIAPTDFFTVFNKKTGEEKRLLIVGAGDAGEKVLREIRDNPGVKLYPVGFLDDSPGKQGKTIHGVPVLGVLDDIDKIPVVFEEILIAIPSIKGQEMRRVVSLCEKSGKRFRTIPGIGELIDGKVTIKAIREVTLSDLLGREEIHLNQEEILHFLRGKKVLVTGAGGSIGSELVRQISRFFPQTVALVEISELNLFRIEMECRQRFESVCVESFLADVRDRESIDRVFREFNPDVVFHAAAYKHVPLQELHPWEAIYTNILGSRNLIQAAGFHGVKRFVQVSTDKAVRPTNVMGASKRVAEMIAESQNGNSQTRFVAVRFGNVVGSSGSAIPIFQEQIARGGPVTVTHPEITRYFMSIPEAAQLILQAGAMARGGETFILEMGDPVRILDLARDMIRLHGFEPDQDIAIQFIGLRPGEKLFEELITQGEGIVATAHEKIMVLQGAHSSVDHLNNQIDELLTITRTFDAEAIKRKLQDIVPEYRPQSST